MVRQLRLAVRRRLSRSSASVPAGSVQRWSDRRRIRSTSAGASTGQRRLNRPRGGSPPRRARSSCAKPAGLREMLPSARSTSAYSSSRSSPGRCARTSPTSSRASIRSCRKNFGSKSVLRPPPRSPSTIPDLRVRTSESLVPTSRSFFLSLSSLATCCLWATFRKQLRREADSGSLSSFRSALGALG